MISFLARAAQAANMRDTKSTVDDAKAESDTKIEQGEDVKLEQGASAKRWCSNVRKQCSKMEGDLTLFQDGCRVGVRIKCWVQLACVKCEWRRPWNTCRFGKAT